MCLALETVPACLHPKPELLLVSDYYTIKGGLEHCINELLETAVAKSQVIQIYEIPDCNSNTGHCCARYTANHTQ